MECPVCGSLEYEEWSGLDREGGPVEPPSGHCPACEYVWLYERRPVHEHIAALRDWIAAMEEELPRLRRALAAAEAKEASDGDDRRH